MSYRLGLDLGTNSIGWSVYSLDEDGKPASLEDLGVRIFSDGRNPKTKEPLAVERRTARGQRHLVRRRKQRRRVTFRLLQRQGFFPQGNDEAQRLKSLNPYELRIKALDEKLGPHELGRALFHLSVRRGFKSNRKDDTREEPKESSKSEKLSQGDRCANLAGAIRESGCRTLGEFLWSNREERRGVRFVADRPGGMDYYPTRQLYIDEFNLIRRRQERFYPEADWNGIFNSIFFQRPLRPQERGKCQYMPEQERTFKAMPCAQRARILQDVHNLTFTKDGKTHRLLPEWQDELVRLLDSKEKVTFADMRKKLGLDAGIVFNLESESRDFLRGNETAVKLRSKKRFGELWDGFSLQEQDDIVDVLITAEEDAEVRELLEKYNLTSEQGEAITKLVLPAGTTGFCREFTERVVAEMERKRCPLHKAVENLGYRYAEQAVQKSDTLPYYGRVLVGATMGAKPNPKNDEERFGKISNPTVHIALNQTRVVVNALIKEYGRPRQVVVEVGRELKASREAKERIASRMAANQKRNAILNQSIRDANSGIQFPNRTDRLKFRLWEELNPEDAFDRKCIYCGKQIGGADIFNGNVTQIEHILPFGRTLWDSERNKTISHTKCNAFKGEKSPFEAFGHSPAGYDWDAILERASRLKDPQKRRLFCEDAMEKFEKDSGFIDRQLTDNAYLSRMARRYLCAVVDRDSDVWCVAGGMTSLVREAWDIDSILKRKIGEREIARFGLKDEQIGTYKKNRLDHRHHALDACVIALIDRGMVQEIARKNALGQRHRIETPQLVPRAELIEKVRSIVVSHKPDHGAEGKLSKETLLGKIKRPKEVPVSEIKTERDIRLIRDDGVRSAFEAKFKETGDVRKAAGELKDIYPKLWVYEEVFVSRAAVATLKEKDIEHIIDGNVRERLEDFVARHKGEKIEDVMRKFSERTGIRKVRCRNRVQTPIKIANSDGTARYLCPEDYLAAVIWEIPARKERGKPAFKATFIRRDEVGKDGLSADEKKPHPAARKVGILYKNDCLEFVDNGTWYKARVAGFSATDNKLDIRPMCSTKDCADWLVATNDSMAEPCWKMKTGQNYVSVNVLFGEKQARPITVSPIGKVFRKK